MLYGSRHISESFVSSFKVRDETLQSWDLPSFADILSAAPHFYNIITYPGTFHARLNIP